MHHALPQRSETKTKVGGVWQPIRNLAQAAHSGVGHVEQSYIINCA